jgi:anti-sigma regulatory factor (Ser/Thr protein kinase)
VRDEVVVLDEGTLVALYTDGLVEQRGHDIDAGIAALAEALRSDSGDYPSMAARVVDEVVLLGSDGDDIALLLVRALAAPAGASRKAAMAVPPGDVEVHTARAFTDAALRSWGVDETYRSDIVLVVSELVTNALVYGRPPIEVRLRHRQQGVVLEVHDGASVMPTLMRPSTDDEHGRGLQLAAALSERWGARPTSKGKAVWCTFDLGAGRRR